MKDKYSIIPVEQIERKIYLIRGHKVMFDSDLADLYEVPVRVFNQAVKRNISVFLKTSCSSLQKRKNL